MVDAAMVAFPFVLLLVLHSAALRFLRVNFAGANHRPDAFRLLRGGGVGRSPGVGGDHKLRWEVGGWAWGQVGRRGVGGVDGGRRGTNWAGEMAVLEGTPWIHTVQLMPDYYYYYYYYY